MIWLTWRQLRASALTVAAALVCLAVAVAVTGPGLATRYTAGIADCTTDNTCDRFFDRFFGEYQLPFMALSLVVLLLPGLVGLFWGAPLITRELEADTHLLVWNQSVTRTRWLAVKVVLTGVVAVAGAGLCALLVTWWSRPLDRSAPPGLGMMDPLIFGTRGILPMAYAAFAFVLGVTVGMLVHRTLPAMALTLAVFVGLQLAVPLLVRPALMPPVTGVFELSTENVDGLGSSPDGSVHLFLDSAVPGSAGAWVLSSILLDPSGHAMDPNDERETVPVSTTSGPCAAQLGGFPSCVVEINRMGYRQRATYQPLDRFWPFQWIETGIYALLTLGLARFSFWCIRRRVS